MPSINAFDIFLLNYKNPTNLNDIKDLCQLRIINKETNTFSLNLIKKFKYEHKGILYSHIASLRKEVICTKCNLHNTKKTEPFTRKPLCDKCYPTYITLTDAKKIYKLKDTDLEKLDYTMVFVNSYRIYATLYQTQDIHALSVIKTGISKPIVKYRGCARKKRIEKFDNLYKKYIIDPNIRIKIYDIFEEFMRNGAGGIRKLEANMKKWPEYIKHMKKENSTFRVDTYYKIFKNYIQDSLSLSDIQSEITKRKEYIESINTEHHIDWNIQQDYIEFGIGNIEKYLRKQKLENALKIHNLKYRQDSVICNKYINDEDDAYDLEKTVNIMRTMNYLYKQTNYGQIYTQMLNKEYSDAKELIRNTHGYIHNPGEYQNILNDHVDKHKISEKAKMKTLQNIKDIPDFVFMQ